LWVILKAHKHNILTTYFKGGIMAKSDYEQKNVKFSLDGRPIREVVRTKPRSKMSGQVFHKSFSNSSAIAVEDIWIVNITDSDVSEYGDFNSIVVHNSSDVDIEIRFNGSTTNKRLVKSSTTIIDTDHKFWKIDIYNTSATTEVAIEEVVVEISKVN
jgi:hypothetical protein